MLSWRTKLLKLLCLKWRGSSASAKSVGCQTTKLLLFFYTGVCVCVCVVDGRVEEAGGKSEAAAAAVGGGWRPNIPSGLLLAA